MNAKYINTKYTNSAAFHCLENLEENSLDLNLIHTGKEHCIPGHIYSGIRNEYIIHFVLSGSGFYSTDDSNNTWPLSAGQMFVIYPNEHVTYGSSKHDPLSYAWIGFRGMRAETLLKQCNFSKGKRILPSPDSSDILKFIDQILKHKALTKANDLVREANLLLLLSYLIEFHTKNMHKDEKEDYDYSSNVYVSLAIEHIKLMYSKGISVQDIAEHIGISRAYLNRAFQKELNLSVQKFLINFRMHKAASLLNSTNMSVKEISTAVGYDDQLAFSKTFKKKFGVSPKNFRSYDPLPMDTYAEKQS